MYYEFNPVLYLEVLHFKRWTVYGVHCVHCTACPDGTFKPHLPLDTKCFGGCGVKGRESGGGGLLVVGGAGKETSQNYKTHFQVWLTFDKMLQVLAVYSWTCNNNKNYIFCQLFQIFSENVLLHELGFCIALPTIKRFI